MIVTHPNHHTRPRFGFKGAPSSNISILIDSARPCGELLRSWPLNGFDESTSFLISWSHNNRPRTQDWFVLAKAFAQFTTITGTSAIGINFLSPVTDNRFVNP
ncbi:d4bb1f3c-0fbd-4ef1-9f61-7c98aa910c7e [Sclerotinia trifoliorum]|uniref:D4bb1f3c-0fbd-4ef1-9f61-7c98aa910c7e n=1 Tax=Sclerotinia trifoliorum TaxID=28548 RepID=A0A8H2VYA7_9HELO|nr:d4bb1f3c-0fbd-4ef1-9f61-7c98aa910c7e [Sclerotinia trifoliorum]